MKKFLCAAAALALLIAMSVPVWAQENEDMPAAPDWDAVIEDFFEENNIDPQTVTLGYYNTVTGEEHYHRGDAELTAGSITKVPLNMYFAEKIYKFVACHNLIVAGKMTYNTHNHYSSTKTVKD